MSHLDPDAKDSRLEHLEQSLDVEPRSDPGETLSRLTGCRGSKVPRDDECVDRSTFPRPVSARTVSHFLIPLFDTVGPSNPARLQLSLRAKGAGGGSRRLDTRFLIPANRGLIRMFFSTS